MQILILKIMKQVTLKNTTATLADNNAGPKITCKKSAKTLGEKKTHRKRSNGIVLDFV